jgi:hypothetical protein
MPAIRVCGRRRTLYWSARTNMTMSPGVAALTLAVWFVGASHIAAHHSVVGQFDPARPITLQGVVTRVNWSNPHVWIYLDVARPNGAAVNWAVECAPPGIMRGSGVERLLATGDRVTITAYRARSTEDPLAHAYDIVLGDGRRFVIGLKL